MTEIGDFVGNDEIFLFGNRHFHVKCLFQALKIAYWGHLSDIIYLDSIHNSINNIADNWIFPEYVIKADCYTHTIGMRRDENSFTIFKAQFCYLIAAVIKACCRGRRST